jgi:T-complex protein 1 subunit alpha
MCVQCLGITVCRCENYVVVLPLVLTPRRAPSLPNTTSHLAALAALLQSGLDLATGSIRDNIAAGVLEPALSKTKIIQFATEAAITILRIDDLIRLEPEPEEADDH